MASRQPSEGQRVLSADRVVLAVARQPLFSARPHDFARTSLSFADVVRVELADTERSELGMLDAHDLSRCRVQRSFEASR
jgi:hypothetical protein